MAQARKGYSASNSLVVVTMSKRLVDGASSSVVEMGRAEREMKLFRMVNSRERSNVVDGDGMEDSYF